MKFAKVGALFVIFFGIFSICQAGIEEMLRDPLYVRKQIDCVLERNVCDRFGKSLKASIEEVLGNDCRGCTKQQMVNALKIMEFMEKYHQAEWYEILMKYQRNAQRRSFGPEY